MRSIYFFLLLGVNSAVLAVNQEQAHRHQFETLIQQKIGHQKLCRNEAYVTEKLLEFKEKIQCFEEVFFENIIRLEEGLLQNLEILHAQANQNNQTGFLSPFSPMKGLQKGRCFVAVLKKGLLSKGWTTFLESLYAQSLIEHNNLDLLKQGLESQLSLDFTECESKEKGLHIFLSCYGHQIENTNPAQIQLIWDSLEKIDLITDDALSAMQSYLRFYEMNACLQYLKLNQKKCPPLDIVFEKRKNDLRFFEKEWITKIFADLKLNGFNEANFIAHDLFIPKMWQETLSNHSIIAKLSPFSSRFQSLNEEESIADKLNHLMGLEKAEWVENVLEAYFKNVEPSPQLISILQKKRDELDFFDQSLETSENGDDENEASSLTELTHAVNEYFCLEAVSTQFCLISEMCLPQERNLPINLDLKEGFSRWMRLILREENMQKQRSYAEKECVQHQSAISYGFSALKTAAYQGFVFLLDEVEQAQPKIERKADWANRLSENKNLIFMSLIFKDPERLIDHLTTLSNDLYQSHDAGFNTLLEFETWMYKTLFFPGMLDKETEPFLRAVSAEYFKPYHDTKEMLAYLSEALEKNPYFKKNLLGKEISFFDKNIIRNMYRYVQKKLFVLNANHFQKKLDSTAFSWDLIDSHIQKNISALQTQIQTHCPHAPTVISVQNNPFLPQAVKNDLTYQELFFQIDHLYPQYQDDHGATLSEVLQKHFGLASSKAEAFNKLNRVFPEVKLDYNVMSFEFRFFDVKFSQEIEAYFALKNELKWLSELMLI